MTTRSWWRRIGALAAAVVAVTGASASGAAAAAEANERFVLVAAPSAPQRVIAAGVIDERGVAASSFHPGPAGSFTIDATWTFSEGRLFVHAQGTFTADDTNTAACVRRDDTVGTIDITGGDGAYADVRGTGTFRATNLFIGTRTDDGCSFVGVAPLQVVQFDATLTGTGDA